MNKTILFTASLQEGNLYKSYNEEANVAAQKFNDVIEKNYSHKIKFYENIAIFNGTIISLSISLLVSLISKEGSTINQYKWLLILGWTFLAASLIIAASYRILLVEHKDSESEINYINKSQTAYSFYQELLQKQSELSAETKETIANINLIKEDWNEKISKVTSKQKVVNFFIKLVPISTSLLTIFGATLILLYSGAQLFDF